MNGEFTAALRNFGFDGETLRDLTALNRRGTPGFDGKKSRGKKKLAADADRLSDLQELLYANASSPEPVKRSLLLIIQGMDTSGKGGIMRHVVSSMDPQGVNQVGFKRPTKEELEHDFLWRIRKHVPSPGMVSVFDRSHYEDVLVHRVEELTAPSTLERRYGSIRQFEKDLAREGTTVLKVMLHISPQEQYERLDRRLKRPDKHWKFDPSDIDHREQWDDYMEAYRIAIGETDTDDAPWFVVPADRKWYARLAVQQLLIESFASLDLQWPTATFDVAAQQRRLEATR